MVGTTNWEDDGGEYIDLGDKTTECFHLGLIRFSELGNIEILKLRIISVHAGGRYASFIAQTDKVIPGGVKMLDMSVEKSSSITLKCEFHKPNTAIEAYVTDITKGGKIFKM